MREIKFRAWDKWRDKMIQPNDGDFIGWHAMKNWKDCLEVMQFTGLRDKNGKEIYEGDIVGEKDVWWETVIFDQGCFCVDIEPIGHHFEEEGAYLEVLGNIYENPELMGAR